MDKISEMSIEVYTIIKSALFILIVVSVFNYVGCQKNDPMNQAYRSIYLSKYAKDFPVSKEKLDYCVTNKVSECIEIYDIAKKGKEILLSQNPDIALKHILKTINKRCTSNNSNDKSLCKGALMSLYYFNDNNQDLTILEAFKHLPPSVKKLVFGNSQYAWFSNRHNIELWVKYVEGISDKLFVKVNKEDVINYFTSPINQYKKLGITLI